MARNTPTPGNERLRASLRGDVPGRRGRLPHRTAAGQLAATLATLGLFGVAVWAEEPPTPVAQPFTPQSAPVAAPRDDRPFEAAGRLPDPLADHILPGVPPLATQAYPGGASSVPTGAALDSAPVDRDSQYAPPESAFIVPGSSSPAGGHWVTPDEPLEAAETAPLDAIPGVDLQLDAPRFRNGGTSNGSKLLGKLGEDLTIGGSMTTSYRLNEVSGGPEGTRSYQNEFNTLYDAQRLGPLQQRMDLTIHGKVLNLFNVNARLSNSRYGNYANHAIALNYKGHGTTIDAGNVNVSLTGNSLVTFSKNLQGLLFSRDFGGGRVRMTGLASITRAATRSGSFRGEDKTGPYYVGGGAIMEGTERLRLDGTELQRDRDYAIDYLQGTINFLNGRIIPSASTVEYSYESRSYNTTPGFLYGNRFDFMLPGGGNAGVTWIQQKSTGRASQAVDRLERFPIVQDPGYRYVLSSSIEPGTPVEVWWIGQADPLIPEIDYELNIEQRAIRLKRVLPPDTSLTGTASLSIRYRPQRTAAVGGDRSVLGLDGSVPIGGAGNLAIQFGSSQGADRSSTGQAITATASLRSRHSGPRNQWSVNTTWRDIGTGFSTIDSVSGAFLRAEKGLSTNLTYGFNEYINFNSSYSQSQIAVPNFIGSLLPGQTLPGAGDISWSANNTWNAALSINLPNWPSLDLTHNEIRQSGLARSSFISDNLNFSWRQGILSLNGGLGKTVSRGRSVFTGYGYGGSGNTGTGSFLPDLQNGVGQFGQTNDSESLTQRLSISLTPANWVSLTGNIGLANNRQASLSGAAGSASSTRARDMSVGTTLTPLRNLSIQASLSDSSNGQSTASYFTPPTGIGNPLTPAIDSGSGVTGIGYGHRTQAQQLAIQYSPLQNLTLSFDTSRQLSLIPGYDNTESNTSQFAFSYAPLSILHLSGAFVDQKVTYVGNQGDSANRSYTLSGIAGPFRNITLSSSYQLMNTGSAIYYGGGGVGGGAIPGINGSPSTGGSLGLGGGGGFSQRQNLSILSTRVDYPIGGGRSVFLQWQSLDTRSPFGASDPSGTGGYRIAANTRRSVGTLGVDFRLSSIMGFTVETNLINLVDRDDTRFSYRARTMNADLSARF